MNHDFPPQKNEAVLKALLKTDAGKTLQQQAQSNPTLQNAISSASSGDMEAARAALAQFLNAPEARGLMEKLQEAMREQHG